MNSTFDAFHPDSRVWVYTSNQLINDQTHEDILKDCAAFLSRWAAHGSDLKASAQLLEGYFLIIAADETFQMASGCSIDSAVRFVQELGAKYNINFFERTNLMFKIDGSIRAIQLSELSEQITAGLITRSTPYFNSNISTLKELNDNWLVKAEESWLKRYFNATETV